MVRLVPSASGFNSGMFNFLVSSQKQKQKPLMTQCVSGFALGSLNRIFLLPINGNRIWVLEREKSDTAAGSGIGGSVDRRGRLVMPQAEAASAAAASRLDCILN